MIVALYPFLILVKIMILEISRPAGTGKAWN